MTARHVVDPADPDVETNDLPLKSSIQFVIGPVRDQTKVRKATDISKLPEILDSTKAIPVAWGQYQFPKQDDPAGKRKANWENYNEDWALLKLEKCLGAGAKGYIPLALEGITSETLLKREEPLPARGISGPPVSGISHLVDDENCEFWGQVEFPLWNSTCFARPGSSGSPILISGRQWRLARGGDPDHGLRRRLDPQRAAGRRASRRAGPGACSTCSWAIRSPASSIGSGRS